MSIQAMTWVLEHSRSRAIDRLVLLSMANHENEGFVAISKARLAAEAGDISEASIRRSWRGLQDIGEIAPASEARAPKWWLEIDVRRRPRLWVMTAFLGRQSDTPTDSRGVSGVSQGRHSSDTRSFSSSSSKHAKFSTSAEVQRFRDDPPNKQPTARFPGELEPWKPTDETADADGKAKARDILSSLRHENESKPAGECR